MHFSPLIRGTLAIVASALLATVPAIEAAGAEDPLFAGFQDPPVLARPHVYWVWKNSYLDVEHARLELEDMKRKGIGGVLIFDVGGRGNPAFMPPKGDGFLSDQWLGNLRAALAKTRELGLQADLSVISSWDMGGPWVRPEHASMQLSSTETLVRGGSRIELPLPFPAVPPGLPLDDRGRPAFWRDIAVLAVRGAERLPGHEIVMRLNPHGIHELTSVRLANGDPEAEIDVRASISPVREFAVAVSQGGTARADFREVLRGELPAQGAREFPLPPGIEAQFLKVTLLSAHERDRSRWSLAEITVRNTTGVNVTASRQLEPTRDGATVLRSPEALSRRNGPARLHDGVESGANGVFVTAGLPPWRLRRDQIVDVTRHVDGEGNLHWDAPSGEWTVLRYVCLLTGQRLSVPGPNADGLTTDHLNPEATRAYMRHVVGRLEHGLGNLRQSGLTNLYLASYEVAGLVWSPGFAAEFARRRGYEIGALLPAVLGAEVDDEETTERFLFDYRKTLGEVVVDAYYRTAREEAHRVGLTLKSEAGGPGPPVHTPPVDSLLANGAIDEIQGEFWPGVRLNMDAVWVVKETASAGHIYGKRRIHMEAFTSLDHWREGPQDLKHSADRAFCEGSNHFVWHTWAHIGAGAGLPGWGFFAGTHLNRNVTWWPQAGAFLGYLGRVSHLLQQGRFVADVLYFYGDDGANFVPPRHAPPELGAGFDYDVTNADVLFNRLSVHDGRLRLPDGVEYRVLVLPERQHLNPKILARLEELVSAGAVVIGPRPNRPSGLEGGAAAVAEVRRLAALLWGDATGGGPVDRSYGKGRVISGRSVREVLAELGVGPDFSAPDAIDFIHRRLDDADIYFLRNRTAAPVSGQATFRVAGRIPESWEPVTGQRMTESVFRSSQAVTQMPIALPPNGSRFIVFRRAGSPDFVEVPESVKVTNDGGELRAIISSNGIHHLERPSGAVTSVRLNHLPQPRDLVGPWSVEFDRVLGGPGQVEFAQLEPWNRRPEEGVRHYSGAATYRLEFDVAEFWLQRAERAVLDLGNLWNIAEVTLNGTSLGILWTTPFRVECRSVLRPGRNQLEIRVVNTWNNRLFGDLSLPPAERLTRTNVVPQANRSWQRLGLQDSGLFGPVRLTAEAIVPLEGGAARQTPLARGVSH